MIRNMLTALIASDRQFGGSHARQYATDYLMTVIEPRLHQHSRAPLRRRLFALSTEFAMRVSAMHLDADQPARSRRLLSRAAGMASEGDDVSLTAWVLSRRGEHEIHQASLVGRRGDRRDGHIEQALAYTEGAFGAARTVPPVSRAFIATKRALAWSMTGNRDATQQALDAVWDAYQGAGSVPEPGWIGAYGLGHLRHEQGRCYVNLGMGPEAVRAAREALALRHDQRPRAFSLGILAIGHAQSHNVDQACATAHELITLAGHLPSRRVCLRVTEVLHALQPYRDEPDVTDVHEAARPVLQGSLA